MSETKFTPRKWHLKRTRMRLPKIVDEKGLTICSGRDYSETANANFDLMVAAPAMYNALKKMLNIFDRNLPEGSIGEILCGEVMGILAEARGENQPQP